MLVYTYNSIFLAVIHHFLSLAHIYLTISQLLATASHMCVHYLLLTLLSNVPGFHVSYMPSSLFSCSSPPLSRVYARISLCIKTVPTDPLLHM